MEMVDITPFVTVLFMLLLALSPEGSNEKEA